MASNDFPVTDSYNQNDINLAGGGAGNVQTTFVYRPRGIASENVYSDWNALIAAHEQVQGPKVIEIDDSLLSPAPIPAGAYDLSDTLVRGDSSLAFPLVLVEFQEGATLTAFEAAMSIRLRNASSSPVFTTASPLVIKLDDATLSSTGLAPFVNVRASSLSMFCMGGGLGGGAPAASVAAGATLSLVVDWSAVILQDTVSGPVGSSVFLVVRSPANFAVNTFSGPVFLGALTTILQALSAEVNYTAGTPADWVPPVPIDVQTAIDRMAALLVVLNAGPIP